MRPDDFEKTETYLQKLDANTRTALKADVNGLKSHLRRTIGSLSYWVRLKPFLALSLGALAGGLIALGAIAKVLPTKKIKWRKRPIKPRAMDALWDPIVRHMMGLATTSALSSYFRQISRQR